MGRHLADGGGERGDLVTRRNEIAHILSDEVRRCAIEFLRQTGPACETGDVAAKVAHAIDESEERVVMVLHHTHLPQLESRGIIEYDKRNGDIRYCGDEILEAVLDELGCVAAE